MTAGEMTLIRVRREIEAELEQLRNLRTSEPPNLRTSEPPNLLIEYRNTPKGDAAYLRRAQASMFHDFYNGAERIFLRVAAELGGVPRGEQWHRQLLQDMTLDLDDLRPAVLAAFLAWTQIQKSLADPPQGRRSANATSPKYVNATEHGPLVYESGMDRDDHPSIRWACYASSFRLDCPSCPVGVTR